MELFKRQGAALSKLNVVRTDIQLPADMSAVSEFLFKCFRGYTRQDNKSWRYFWRRLLQREPGEIAAIEMVFPRSGPFHRYHMAIEQAVFDSQERFQTFEHFLIWMKIGAGWVDWIAGPKGGVVPIARSISYAKADELEFQRFHEMVMVFLHGDRASIYLWKHLGQTGAHEMLEAIIAPFEADRTPPIGELKRGG